jgi:TRAP-type C4-dicarboxylate transport system substrate-binding protein
MLGLGTGDALPARPGQLVARTEGRNSGEDAMFVRHWIAAIGFAAAAAAATTASAETRLLVNVHVVKSHPLFTGLLQPWAERVEAATQGRIKIDFPANTLAPPARAWSMVTSGIADAAYVANGFEENRLRLVSIVQLPFNSPTAESASVALWRTYKKYFEGANEYAGVKLLGLFANLPFMIVTHEKKITALGDLKNMKMRVSAGVGQEVFKRLGSTTIVAPMVQTFDLLSKGVVDGAGLSVNELVALKMAPYVKYVLEVPGGVNGAGLSFIMNKKKWDSLSPADQKAIDEASGELIARGTRAWDEDNARSIQELKGMGVGVDEASQAFMNDLREKVMFAETEWLDMAKAKGIDGKSALAFYRAQLAAELKSSRR